MSSTPISARQRHAWATTTVVTSRNESATGDSIRSF